MNALDEIEAIRSAYLALEPLDGDARTRALAFLGAKLEADKREAPAAERLKPNHPQQAIVDRVVKRVCDATGVSTAQLLSGSRQAEVCQARFAAMVLLRDDGLSLPGIGRALGGRDHSTIFYGLKRAEEMRRTRRFQKILEKAA